MKTDKDLRRCLRFLGMCSSDSGDGVNAAEMLQAVMARTGIKFCDLYYYACDRTGDFQYVIIHFHDLKIKAEKVWRDKTARARAEAKEANAWKFSPDTDPGPDWTWVNPHTRKAEDGSEYLVRGHWRNSPRKKPVEAWRYDANADAGPQYEWIAEHTRWSASNGKGTRITVRGYWRQRLDVLKKAA